MGVGPLEFNEDGVLPRGGVSGGGVRDGCRCGFLGGLSGGRSGGKDWKGRGSICSLGDFSVVFDSLVLSDGEGAKTVALSFKKRGLALKYYKKSKRLTFLSGPNDAWALLPKTCNNRSNTRRVCDQ